MNRAVYVNEMWIFARFLGAQISGMFDAQSDVKNFFSVMNLECVTKYSSDKVHVRS